jgi:hypothetical protein
MKLKHLKKDRALLMTSILLVLMLGAGLFSGIIGFTLGHAALKGVTQPDIRPSNKSINQQNLKTRGLEVLGEQKMLAEARNLMGLPKQGAEDKQPQLSAANKDKPTLVFPIESKDQGIIMIVKSAQPEGNNIKLVATLRNQGSQPAKFGAGVLTLRNDQEQPLNASVAGIPTSLAANGKDAFVKILISKGELGVSKTVALNLTDADRKLQLAMSDIPVAAAAGTLGKTKVKSSLKINIPDGQLTDAEEEENKNASPSAKPSSNASGERPSPNAKPSPKARNKPLAPKPKPSAPSNIPSPRASTAQ